MQKLVPALLIAVLSLSGCSTVRFPGVYRVDIPQGNFVTSDMLVKLAPGMTPDQVRYVMGVPSLVDPFTQDTWFYLMTYQPGKGEPVDQQIIVHFDNGVFSHYDGEVIKDLQKKTQAEKDAELHKKADQQRRDSEADTDTAPDKAAKKDAAKAAKNNAVEPVPETETETETTE
jgi:outer membrane protein assembly factor BamE